MLNRAFDSTGMLPHTKLLRFGRRGHPPDRLVHGDNLPVLSDVSDASVDMVYVDPPFGTGTVKSGRGGKNFRDPMTCPEEFVGWLTPRLEETHRVLRDHGSLFVHLDYRTVHYVKVALDRIFGRGQFINEIIWCYSVGGKGRRSFGRKHDTILWYGRSTEYAFYPDAVRVARKPKSHMRVVLDEHGNPVQEKTDRRTGRVYRYPVNQGKVPEDWWIDIETLNRGDRERVGWPTQKPARLIERLILATTEPGARVGDWFCGSGTTAVVAQRLDRGFVAIDAEEQAIRVAGDRLAEAGKSLAAAGTPPRDLRLELRGKVAA